MTVSETTPVKAIITVTALVLFVVIAVIPIAWMLVRAFSIDGAPSLGNFAALFSDPRQAGLLARSLVLAAGTTATALLLGVPMGFYIHRARVVGHRFVKYLYLLPLAIPPQVFVTTWLTMAGMFSPGILQEPASPLLASIFAMIAAIAMLGLAYYPLVVLTTLSGLGAMDRRLEEAASLVKAPFDVWRRITLPLLLPYTAAGAIFVFLFALFDYGVPALLGVQTYPVEIFAQFSAFYNEGRAAALSLPLLLVAVGMLGLVQKQKGTRPFFTVGTGSVAAPSPVNNSIVSGALIAGWSWVIIIFSIILPLVVLFVQAASPQVLLAVIRTSSWEIGSTVFLSATAASLMALLAYPMAERIIKSGKVFSRTVDYLSLLPFALPATVLGIGLIYVWNRPILDKVYGSAAILVIAFTARFAPFAVRAVTAGFSQVSPSLWEAAALSAKPGFRRWRCIEWPLLKRSVAAGWLIVFILCMNELGATLLVIPPGSGTLSLKIYNLMHYGANQMVAGMALVLVGINLSAAGIVAKAFIAKKVYSK